MRLPLYAQSFKARFQKEQTRFKGRRLIKKNAKREYLLNILIMHQQHFHFHSVVAARLHTITSHHCMVDLSAALEAFYFRTNRLLMCNVPSIQLTKHNSHFRKPNQVWTAWFYKSRCSAMQPAFVCHFGSNYSVITMDMIIVKIVLKLFYHFRVYKKLKISLPMMFSMS